jgi:uncharacterized protein (UPF0332 family)
VTPEAARYLEKAGEDLSEAQQIAAIHLAKVAARSAYYAAFHAAEAYIVAKTGRVARTHSGVRAEFSRLAKDDPLISKSLITFLPQAYRYKEIGDYSLDPDAVITMGHAEAAIISAAAFINGVRNALV